MNQDICISGGKIRTSATRARDRLFVLVKIALACLAAVCTVEGLLHAVLTLPEARDEYWDRGALTGSSKYGIRMTPNYSGIHARRGEYEVSFSVDRDGFRNTHLPSEKSPTARRVLIIGKSMTFGVGVKDDETFTSVLLAMHANQSGQRLEVLNLAQPAYAYDMLVDLFQEYVDTYRPDHVVLEVSARTNVILRREGAFDRIEVVDGVVVGKARPFSGTCFDWVRTHSYAGMMCEEHARRSYYNFKDHWSGEPKPFAGAWRHSPATEGEIHRVARERARNWREGLRPQLARLQAICRDRGITLSMLIIPTRQDKNYNAVTEEAIHRELRAAAKKMGWPVTDISSGEMPYRPGSDLTAWFADDNHPTAAGHVTIAQRLAQDLDRLDRAAGSPLMSAARGVERR